VRRTSTPSHRRARRADAARMPTFERIHPVLAFVVGSVLAAGVTRAWYVDEDLLVPVALFVFAAVLLVVGEVEHYRTSDGK